MKLTKCVSLVLELQTEQNKCLMARVTFKKVNFIVFPNLDLVQQKRLINCKLPNLVWGKVLNFAPGAFCNED